MPVLNPQALVENRVAAIRDFHNSIGVAKAEIDVSGGVDSAVIAGLLAKALGPENVIAVHSRIDTNPEQTARAKEVADRFGVRLVDFDLTDIYSELVESMVKALVYRDIGPTTNQTLAAKNAAIDAYRQRFEDDPSILGSIRSTLRAPIGRGFNRIDGGGIRHGTGNECEDRWCRFFQKGGDGEVDTNPIAMLSKAEVYQLALALGVPKSVITATPSPDLWGSGDTHNDEDEFADYFGFKAADYGQTFYGYIDVETGAYTKVGLIERVSRWLDEPTGLYGNGEDVLFDDAPDDWLSIFSELEPEQYDLGTDNPELATKLLKAARRIEAMTRHKMNPNCPALGDRASLVEAGILTNTLPTL